MLHMSQFTPDCRVVAVLDAVQSFSFETGVCVAVSSSVAEASLNQWLTAACNGEPALMGGLVCTHLDKA